jgi:hypothetical protein
MDANLEAVILVEGVSDGGPMVWLQFTGAGYRQPLCPRRGHSRAAIQEVRA